MILGIIMFEDVFLAVYIFILSGLVLSNSSSLGGVLLSAIDCPRLHACTDYHWT